MALVLLDRVRETTTSTGTGTITLAGAVAGYQPFSAVGNGNTTYYTIYDTASNDWEVGIGTYTLSGNTLSRTTVLSSSNGGSLVIFSAGSKEVFVTYPAEKAIYEEVNGETLINGGPITVVGSGVTSIPSLPAELGKFVGNVDSFAQIYNLNQNDGSSASADFVAYNDLTDDGYNNFTDMGINSSNYTSVDYPLFTPGSGYVFHDGDDFFIGNQTPNKDVVLFAGGADTTDEAVRISGTDRSVTLDTDLNVGGALDVTGAAEFGSTVLLNQNPTLALQAATKEYVDNQVTAGIHIHEPVRVETTGNLNATYVQGGTTFDITDITSTTTVTTSVNHGLSVNDQIWLYNTAGNGLSTNTAYFVYSTPAANQLTLSLTFGGAQITGLTNASGLTYNTRANSGVGATLTNAGTKAALTVDGVLLSTTNRVMVRLQTNGAENGVYVVTTVGTPDPGGTNWVLTRAADANQVNPANPDGVGTGDYFFTREGLLNAGDSHVLTTEPNTMIIGYTTLTYTQFSGGVTYTGGTNIDVTGQTISLTGTVAATNGGTGTSTVTTGDLLYGSGANTWGKLPVGAAYKSLVVNGAGTQVEWNAVALSQAGSVSGALPATNGGTGLSSFATGDLIYSSATNTLTVLPGNTTTTKKFLNQTGTGSASQAPSWDTIANTDVLGLGTMSTQNANTVAITGGTIENTIIGATTPTLGTFTLLTDSGNLNFTGTGNRITGDFSNATLANRVMFQTSTVNGNTSITAIPNGTGTVSALRAVENSDPTNAAFADLLIVQGSDVRLRSDKSGTGTYLPMTFYTGGSERFRYGTSGEFGIAGANYGTSGQVLTSGGSGAAPSWQTIATTPQVQSQTLSSGSGTWNKPTTGDYQWLQIEVWAGGGSGGKAGATNRAASGGGGGAYNTITVPLSYLASSESYTVGAGGAAVSTNIVGNVGGNTSFTISNWPVKSASIAAFGGGGGGSHPSSSLSGGGGGGGTMSAGASGIIGNANGAAGGEPMGGTVATSFTTSSTYGGGSGSTGTSSGPPGGLSYFGGGGGGGGSISTTGQKGGNSHFGGAGAGGSATTNIPSGGTSIFGGNGAPGCIPGGNGVAGSVPGGGGGPTMNGANSGAGGAGSIRLTWW